MKKTTKKKKVAGFVLGLAFVMLFIIPVLGGCGGSHYGLNVGFDYSREGGRWQPDVWVAVRSEGFYFDVNNVEIEFFFGPRPTSLGWTGGRIGLYFYRGNHWSSVAYALQPRYQEGHEDYENVVDELVFIESFCGSDFSSGKFEISQSFFRGRQFNHSQKIIIPDELFTGEGGGIRFSVMGVATIIDSDDGLYHIWEHGWVNLRYELISYNRVRITEANYNRYHI